MQLLLALKEETKLFAKLALCEALVVHQKDAIKLLVKELGQIGCNQHRRVPDKIFKKDSCPLPRDLAARVLGRIGKEALPQLAHLLATDIEKVCIQQLSEAIDAVGFICFYDYQLGSFDFLKNCYYLLNSLDLIAWEDLPSNE